MSTVGIAKAKVMRSLLTVLAMTTVPACAALECKRPINKDEAVKVAEGEMARILKREGPHEYNAEQTEDGWIIHVDQIPIGVGRNKTIYLDKCGRILKVEGGR